MHLQYFLLDSCPAASFNFIYFRYSVWQDNWYSFINWYWKEILKIRTEDFVEHFWMNFWTLSLKVPSVVWGPRIFCIIWTTITMDCCRYICPFQICYGIKSCLQTQSILQLLLQKICLFSITPHSTSIKKQSIFGSFSIFTVNSWSFSLALKRQSSIIMQHGNNC